MSGVASLLRGPCPCPLSHPHPKTSWSLGQPRRGGCRVGSSCAPRLLEESKRGPWGTPSPLPAPGEQKYRRAGRPSNNFFASGRCRPDGGRRLGRGVSHTGGACPGASALPAVMLLPLPPAFRKFPSRKASGNPRGEVPASGCSPGMRLGPCCTELPPQRPAGTAQLCAAPRAAVPEPSPQGQRFRRLTQPCTCRCPGEEEEAAAPRVP